MSPLFTEDDFELSDEARVQAKEIFSCTLFPRKSGLYSTLINRIANSGTSIPSYVRNTQNIEYWTLDIELKKDGGAGASVHIYFTDNDEARYPLTLSAEMKKTLYDKVREYPDLVKGEVKCLDKHAKANKY